MSRNIRIQRTDELYQKIHELTQEGRTNKEISYITGKSYSYICKITNFQKQLSLQGGAILAFNL